jgi:hypothetical protein
MNVGPVKALHHHVWLAHAEPIDDLLPHGRGGCRCQGEDRWVTELLDHGTQA